MDMWPRPLSCGIDVIAIHSSHRGLPEVQGGPVNYLLLQGILMFLEPPACSRNTEKGKNKRTTKSTIHLCISREHHTAVNY